MNAETFQPFEDATQPTDLTTAYESKVRIAAQTIPAATLNDVPKNPAHDRLVKVDHELLPLVAAAELLRVAPVQVREALLPNFEARLATFGAAGKFPGMSDLVLQDTAKDLAALPARVVQFSRRRHEWVGSTYPAEKQGRPDWEALTNVIPEPDVVRAVTAFNAELMRLIPLAEAGPMEAVDAEIDRVTKQMVDLFAQAGLAPAEAAEAADTIPLNQVRYFQVEDQAVIPKLIQMILEQLGVKPATIDGQPPDNLDDVTGLNASDALAKLRAIAESGNEITLLILDQIFPKGESDEDGPADEVVARGLKALMTDPKTEHAFRKLKTVVHFSGTATDADTERIKAVLPGMTVVRLGKPAAAAVVQKSVVHALAASKTISKAVEAETIHAIDNPVPRE